LFHPVADIEAAQVAAGLDPALPVALVSAGALGVSPTEAVLEGLYRLQHRIQAVIVCGKNAELQHRMEKRIRENPPQNVTVKLLGFTDEMHKWMGVADFFIGKPGGLTTSEALAMSLPMVIISPIPGQEERNSDHLLEKGIAIRCNEFTTLPYKLDLLLDDPERFQSLRENAAKYGRPRAAQTIVDKLLHDEFLQAAPVELSSAVS
jgi:processive 1,2-diacylglycerol beta-glucosyltransferase